MRGESGRGKQRILFCSQNLGVDPEGLGRLDGSEKTVLCRVLCGPLGSIGAPNYFVHLVQFLEQKKQRVLMIMQDSNGDIAQLSYNPSTFLGRSSQGRRLGEAASAAMRQWILPLLTGIDCLCPRLY
jgi:hypothetical protein